MYPRNDLFAVVWRKMEEAGQCDSLGGCEYERVYKEFCESNAVRHFIRCFITEAANRPAQSFPHTDVSHLFDRGE